MRITNPVRFRRILEKIKKEQGSQKAAAEILGISEGHLSRLLRGEPKWIEQRTATVIARGLRSKPKLYREFIVEALLGTEATAIYDGRYRAWLRKALRPYSDRRGHITSEGRAGQCNRVLKRLRKGVHADVFERFDTATQRHHADRRILALWRTVEPLLASEESGGVERTIDELETNGELGPYLKAALRREQILLHRKPDFERAQEVHLDRGEPMAPRLPRKKRKNSPRPSGATRATLS